jgi:hypothetical protein
MRHEPTPIRSGVTGASVAQVAEQSPCKGQIEESTPSRSPRGRGAVAVHDGDGRWPFEPEFVGSIPTDSMRYGIAENQYGSRLEPSVSGGPCWSGCAAVTRIVRGSSPWPDGCGPVMPCGPEAQSRRSGRPLTDRLRVQIPPGPLEKCLGVGIAQWESTWLKTAPASVRLRVPTVAVTAGAAPAERSMGRWQSGPTQWLAESPHRRFESDPALRGRWLHVVGVFRCEASSPVPLRDSTIDRTRVPVVPTGRTCPSHGRG